MPSESYQSPEAKQNLTEEEMRPIRQETLNIAESPEYKISDEKEVAFLKNLAAEFKTEDLLKKYGEYRKEFKYRDKYLGEDRNLIGFPVQRWYEMEADMRNRLFAGLYVQDSALVRDALRQAHNLMSGARFFDENGEYLRGDAGCICENCAGLVRMADASGVGYLADTINKYSICTSYSDHSYAPVGYQLTQSSRSWYKRGWQEWVREKFPNATEYKKYLDDILKEDFGLARSKTRLHTMYEESLK